MKIYPQAHMASGQDVRTFTFPDGQPHIYAPNLNPAVALHIRAALRNSEEVMQLLLLRETLAHLGHGPVSLLLTYLLGGRMDRRISATEPFTLKVVAQLINSANFYSVGLLDPHSGVSPALIDRSYVVSPQRYVNQARDEILQTYHPHCLTFIAPDAGAQHRTEELAQGAPVVQCLKVREPLTGKLSGFRVLDPDNHVPGSHCLLVDDICDGGRTFTSIASQLWGLGAAWVGLYITHGIFSKGVPLAGIEHIWTTDSYYSGQSTDDLTVLPLL